MPLYKIEEVAKECGLTKRAIRYYEEIGLLCSPERTEGGFRMYSDQDIRRLKQIINTRDVLGMSLQEVQEFVSIQEEVNSNILDAKQTSDAKIKTQKLLKCEQVLGKQLQMIERKMKKIMEIREETNRHYTRVREAIEKYKQDGE